MPAIPIISARCPMKLFMTPNSPYARKVRIVLAEKRIEFEQVEVASLAALDSPVPEFNPLGKVPTLLLDYGTGLYDSAVITDYLDKKTPVMHLIPQTKRIDVKRWEALADGMCDAAVAVVMEYRRPAEKQDETLIARQRLKVERGLQALTRDLAENKWCVGKAFSLADIAVGCTLAYINLRMPECNWAQQYPNLAALLEQLNQRKSFQDTQPQP